MPIVITSVMIAVQAHYPAGFNSPRVVKKEKADRGPSFAENGKIGSFGIKGRADRVA